MDLLRLEAQLAEKPGMADLQPSLEQLDVPLCKAEDNSVAGEALLSSSLSVAYQRVKKIKENIAAGRPTLTEVFALLIKPLSTEVLLGSDIIPSSGPVTIVTGTSSTAIAFATFIGSLPTDDYEIMDFKDDGGSISLVPSINFEERKLDSVPEHSHAG
ncbi:hypothetical protein CTI12_AA068030 [Artemisia annua]|uniref:Uncharacterized protein n=1 Tax=Artemisia annua TaxID=35608 RepID=A0A2U1Q724_ARTAN|nr:hypothetical protein CTI12_AA068030 [Artemisia annua]